MTMNFLQDYPEIRQIEIKDRWCVHSYYTLCPYAPDGSGRLLLAGADLDAGFGEVIVAASDGEVIDRFGRHRLNSGFYHTGFWQTWSPDSRFVYYEGGTMEDPKIVRHEIDTGREIVMDGDMEGAPPFGEPIVSGLLGMLYAAGYGDGKIHAEEAPVPFQSRNLHGLFRFTPSSRKRELIFSVNDILERHPDGDMLWKADLEMKEKYGEADGLTLMCYCVRWSPDGRRLLFFFGNHCVDKRRGEPRLSYIFTADRDFKEIHLALDSSNRGHWSWQPDGEHLIGHGPDPEDVSKTCVAEVRYDGTGYRRLSQFAGVHPSLSPADSHLLVNDKGGIPGEVYFVDTAADEILRTYKLPRVFGSKEPEGRNPFRVCHHPVFSKDGKKVIINTLPGRNAVICEIDVERALG